MGPKEIGAYRVIRTIGSGDTWKVKLGQNLKSGELRAIKIINRPDMESKPNLYRRVQREIALLGFLDHPHLIHLYDVLESDRHLYLILEYAENGDLSKFLSKNRSKDEREAMSIFRQLIYGLDFLHQHHICHRDLKPENILLDRNDQIKIADFGFARYAPDDIASTSCGTPNYCSPETIRGQPHSGRAADIWSAGVILHLLLVGYLPFDDPNLRNLLAKIKKGEFEMPNVSPEAADLISRMLTVDPSKRISIEEIKRHSAFRIGLPSQYIVPSPLPLPQLNAPINEVPQSFVDAMKKIGYNSEADLMKELRAEGGGMAKVFFLMMCPDHSRNWKEEEEDGETEIETVRTERLSSSPGSAEANRAIWAVESPTRTVGVKRITREVKLGICETMSEVQTSLNIDQWEWVHPDDYHIIARKGESEVHIEAVLSWHRKEIELDMARGSAEDFNRFVVSISSVFNSANGE